MKQISIPLLCSTLIFVLVQLLIVIECTEEIAHQHHHHRHRHSHGQGEAPCNHENCTTGSGQSEENGGSSTGVSSGSLERRMAFLEENVRYLCMEDEEDVDRRIRHLGVKCICPKTEAPVCGSDNVTYHNRCFLHCHARHALLNYHRYRITLKYFGRCEQEDLSEETDE